MEIKNVKGTHDILSKEGRIYDSVKHVLTVLSEIFAYHYVEPPVLEHSELFVRSVGESSDVVRKEMYTFEDKGGRSLTMRPEFTAGIARMIVQNKLLATNELPLKYFYHGPVFRYERPQLGRFRQFLQFGVESVGTNNPYNDVEVIVLAYACLNSLGFNDVRVKINTLGDEESRNAYRLALKEFFKDKIDQMCPDCKQRYELNPLRILDCKVPEDQEIVKDAPKMSDYISNESKMRFQKVLEALKTNDIPYDIDDTLVRGLDYYSETVFEFHYVSNTGNNYGAIGAGGHYDKLISELGGPNVPGVGFSFGLERIVSIMIDNGLMNPDFNYLDFYVMPLGEAAQNYAHYVANEIRKHSMMVDICYEQVKMGNMFKRAEKKNAAFAIIIGEDEVNNESIVLKNLKTKEQFTYKFEDFKEEMKNGAFSRLDFDSNDNDSEERFDS